MWRAHASERSVPRHWKDLEFGYYWLEGKQLEHSIRGNLFLKWRVLEWISLSFQFHRSNANQCKIDYINPWDTNTWISLEAIIQFWHLTPQLKAQGKEFIKTNKPNCNIRPPDVEGKHVFLLKAIYVFILKTSLSY